MREAPKGSKMQPASCKSLLFLPALRVEDILLVSYSDFSALFPAAKSIAPATAHGTPTPIDTPPVDLRALPITKLGSPGWLVYMVDC